jgi:Membrane bound FAD containing D-sorbitol dehydrogenase
MRAAISISCGRADKSMASRREILLTGLAAAIAAASASGFPAALFAAAPVTLPQFMTLSARLTEAADLDTGIGEKFLGGFLASGQGAGLAGLVAGTSEPELESAIIVAWYSGVYDTGRGKAVAGFEQALLWKALTFTKPPSDCGGEMGYWSQPPVG